MPAARGMILSVSFARREAEILGLDQEIEDEIAQNEKRHNEAKAIAENVDARHAIFLSCEHSVYFCASSLAQTRDGINRNNAYHIEVYIMHAAERCDDRASACHRKFLVI